MTTSGTQTLQQPNQVTPHPKATYQGLDYTNTLLCCRETWTFVDTGALRLHWAGSGNQCPRQLTTICLNHNTNKLTLPR